MKSGKRELLAVRSSCLCRKLTVCRWFETKGEKGTVGSLANICATRANMVAQSVVRPQLLPSVGCPQLGAVSPVASPPPSPQPRRT